MGTKGPRGGRGRQEQAPGKSERSQEREARPPAAEGRGDTGGSGEGSWGNRQKEGGRRAGHGDRCEEKLRMRGSHERAEEGVGAQQKQQGSTPDPLTPRKSGRGRD